MKRNDFIKSLQNIKKQLLHNEHLKRSLLTPTKKQSIKTTCACKDASGEPKYLYSSKKELEYMLFSKEVKLQSYPCPYEKGWHLTKG